MYSIAAMMLQWGSLEYDGEKFAYEAKFERILTYDICILVEQYFEEHDDLELDESTIYDAANWADEVIRANEAYKRECDAEDECTESAMILPYWRKE